jgi:hypothetical protein
VQIVSRRTNGQRASIEGCSSEPSRKDARYTEPVCSNARLVVRKLIGAGLIDHRIQPNDVRIGRGVLVVRPVQTNDKVSRHSVSHEMFNGEGLRACYTDLWVQCFVRLELALGARLSHRPHDRLQVLQARFFRSHCQGLLKGRR